MLQKTFFALAVLILLSLNTPLSAKTLTEDLVANHYEVTLPEGDEGTVYLSSDGSMNFLPFITNNTYTHVCWGEWKFKEKTQRLTIKDASRCRILEGNYQLKPIPMGYELMDTGKKFIFRKFHKL